MHGVPVLQQRPLQLPLWHSVFAAHSVPAVDFALHAPAGQKLVEHWLALVQAVAHDAVVALHK